MTSDPAVPSPPDLPLDLFVLAVGYVALATPPLEAALVMFYGVLADDGQLLQRSTARERMTGANYTAVRREIDVDVARLDETLRSAAAETLELCDEVWTARNNVMHSIWVVNADGYWASRPGRGKTPSQRLGGTPFELAHLVGALRQAERDVHRLAITLIDARRARDGLPPRSGGIIWPLWIDEPPI